MEDLVWGGVTVSWEGEVYRRRRGRRCRCKTSTTYEVICVRVSARKRSDSRCGQTTFPVHLYENRLKTRRTEQPVIILSYAYVYVADLLRSEDKV